MHVFTNPSLAHSFNTEFLSYASKAMHPVSKETVNMNHVTSQEMRSKPAALKCVLCSHRYRSPSLYNEGSRLPHNRMKNRELFATTCVTTTSGETEHSTCAKTHTAHLM